MSDQTLFEQETQPTTSEAPVQDHVTEAPAADPYSALLQGIKSDDGRQKYGTVSDALLSIQHKEQHISTIESENAVLREEIAKLKAQWEAEQAMQFQKQDTVQSNPQTENASAGINVEELVLKVQQGLSAQEQQKQATMRLNTFKDKLVSQFGDRAKDVYTAKLKEAGVSEQAFMATVVENPDFAWKSLGLSDVKPVTTQTVPESSRNPMAQTVSEPDNAYKFRQSKGYRPGDKLKVSRDAVMERLKAQGVL